MSVVSGEARDSKSQQPSHLTRSPALQITLKGPEIKDAILIWQTTEVGSGGGMTMFGTAAIARLEGVREIDEAAGSLRSETAESINSPILLGLGRPYEILGNIKPSFRDFPACLADTWPRPNGRGSGRDRRLHLHMVSEFGLDLAKGKSARQVRMKRKNRQKRRSSQPRRTR